METLQKYRKFYLFEGIAFIIIGLLAITLPAAFTFAIELLIGWLLIVAGVAQGIRAIKSRHAPGFAISFISAILYLAIGILLVLYPIPGILTLTLILAAFFLVEGITKIILSFQLRPLARWGWLLFSGILSFAIAILLWAGWPTISFWVIGLLVGINLIFFGFALISAILSLPKK